MPFNLKNSLIVGVIILIVILFLVFKEELTNFYFNILNFFASNFNLTKIVFVNSNENYQRTLNLEEENRILKEQILLLEEKLITPQETSDFNNLLITQAKILGIKPGSNLSKIIIDKGEEANISKNDLVVVDNRTLVGKVEKVYQNYSEVETIFSPNVKIMVNLLPANQTGLLAYEKNQLIIDYLDNGYIYDNNLIETSGEDGFYLSGLLIGKVSSVGNSITPSFTKVVVEPAFSFNSLKSVSVIKNVLNRWFLAIY